MHSSDAEPAPGANRPYQIPERVSDIRAQVPCQEERSGTHEYQCETVEESSRNQALP